MKKSEKITPLNSIAISVFRLHKNIGGHEYIMLAVTHTTSDGHIKNMLSIEGQDYFLKKSSFLGQLLKKSLP